jgi:hypothetical protein
LTVTKLKEHTVRDEAFVRTIGYRLKNRLGTEIDAEQRDMLKGYAPKAFQQIQNLAENAESENVRLKANSDILDRAGYRPIDKSEITQMNKYEHMTTEEMQAELDALYAKQGFKVVKE